MILRQSFVQIPGVGLGTERKLRSQGLGDWNDLRAAAAGLFKPEKRAQVLQALDDSERALGRRDLRWFYEALPRDQLWRLVPGNLDDVAYLDIETTGTGMPPLADSTVICFYFRGEVRQAHEPRAKRELVTEVLAECRLLCTFFGEAFDVPFLQRELGLEFRRAHLDLCHWLRRLGFKGGLKRVQKLFPSIPARLSQDIDGYDAVRLWRMHERGVEGALETLYTYNAEDTVVLHPLLVECFNLEVGRHPGFQLEALPVPGLPGLKTGSPAHIYRMLRQRI
jgi:uncharacterized protein YprB with RNaseH-like and TPR domain